MSTYDIYSKRGSRGKDPEIYTYDILPDKLRVQIHHIMKGAVGIDRGTNNRYKAMECYGFIRKVLIKEYGVFHLYMETSYADVDVLQFLLYSNDTDKVLDVIELCFRVINLDIREDYYYSNYVNVEISPDDAIEELNKRFKENAFGYVFESNRIIRIDSTVTHTEITKPTLKLLSNNLFQNANEEYLKAHEHYRHGRNKEAITECLKAFESVMKIICNAKGWAFSEKDTAKALIKICFENGLIPTYLQNQLANLKAVLESGVPTIRNNVGGHGQGDQKKYASNELVQYVLNLTGSNIIFLAQSSGIK